MTGALLGVLLGLVAGGLSVWSLWLVTGMAAQASAGIEVPPDDEEREPWAFNQWEPFAEIADRGSRIAESPSACAPLPGTPSPAVFQPESVLPSARASLQGEPSPEGVSPWRATRRILFAFLLKAPLLVAVAFGAQKLGTAALYGCAGAVVAVYFFAAFWAAARTRL